MTGAGDPYDSDIELASDDFERQLVDLDLDSKSLVRDSTKRAHPAADAADDDGAYQPTGFGEGGLYMHNKRLKLLKQNAARKADDLQEGESPPTQLFTGMSIYINGNTGSEVSHPQLVALLVSHGATYVPYLDRKGLATHVIASTLTPSKRKDYAPFKVATSQWILESVTADRVLDWRLFQPEKEKPRMAWDEMDERTGISTQRSLFGVGVARLLGAGEGAPAVQDKAAKPVRGPSKSSKPMSETMESLAQRGKRLAEEAIAASRPASTSAHDFFAPRPPPHPTSPSKAKSTHIVPPPTTDPVSPTKASHSYLPAAQRSDHTTARLNDPAWLAENTSASESFLAGYFANSRLHHLSTWKEELKTLVASLQPADRRPERKRKLTGLPSDNRIVFHVDFDAFFVSVGLTTRPELVGKPVAVCHGGSGEGLASTSEIASCSYEARSCGVQSGISLGRARELCPQIITIPYEYELIKSIAAKFYSILISHATFPQAVSIDEVLMEVAIDASSPSASTDAVNLANRIRDEVRDATGCEASIGISHNILLARLASRKAKPAGTYHLLPAAVPALLNDLPVKSLPGVGWSTEQKLNELGVTTVGGLLRVPKSQLRDAIGPKNGDKFAEFAKGVDPRELETQKPRQSVSAEVNYAIRFQNEAQVERFVRQLGEEVVRRLDDTGMRARHLTLHVMQRHPTAPFDAPKFLGHGRCNTFAVSSPIGGSKATNDPNVVGTAAYKAIQSLQIPPQELRGIGIQLFKLEGGQVQAPREKGQNQLAFAVARTPAAAAAPPKASRVEAKPPAKSAAASSSSSLPSDAVPPSNQPSSRRPLRPLKKDVSVIVLDDSDSHSDNSHLPPSSPPPQPQPPRRSISVAPPPAKPRSKKAPPGPKVAAIFGKTSKAASKVIDKELRKLGVDVDAFRAVPSADQAAFLAQQRAKLVEAPTKGKGKAAAAVSKSDKNAKQPRLVGQVSKAALQSSGLPASKIAPAAADIVVIPSSSSSSLTVSQIADLGMDVEVFRGLPKDIQREAREDAERRDALFRVKSVRAATHSRFNAPTRNIIDVPIVQAPMLQSMSDLDDLRDLIEQWVDGAGDEGPNLPDVDDLERFLERCLDRARGQDVAKATGLVSWLAEVVAEGFGREGERGGAAAAEWWGAVKRLRGRVAELVRADWGSEVVFPGVLKLKL